MNISDSRLFHRYALASPPFTFTLLFELMLWIVAFNHFWRRCESLNLRQVIRNVTMLNGFNYVTQSVFTFARRRVKHVDRKLYTTLRVILLRR